MSVLIRGMEIPKKGCCECRLLEGDKYDGFCHGADRWLDDDYFSWYIYPEGDIDNTKPVNCPLDEVPTPHGRLIDADDAFINADERGFDFWCCDADIDSAQSFIQAQPTVIEAEGE